MTSSEFRGNGCREANLRKQVRSMLLRLCRGRIPWLPCHRLRLAGRRLFRRNLACRENAMIVFDASSSMAMLDTGKRRIDIARAAIGKVLPKITRHRATGLVIYSGGGGPLCTDVRLEVEPRPGNTRRILSALGKVQPGGATPLSNAVELAAETLARLGAPGVVVLITDGLENCFRDACMLAQTLKRTRKQRACPRDRLLHAHRAERAGAVLVGCDRRHVRSRKLCRKPGKGACAIF